MASISTVLLDLSGVIFTGTEAIPGAAEAVQRLQAHDVAIRYLTNTTRQPLRVLLETLRKLGIAVSEDQVFTPSVVARRVLKDNDLSPFLLVHPDLREDFDGSPAGEINAVLVGDAGEAFDYDSLNEAFRLLDGGAEFLALANNRTFLDSDDRHSLDAGPFVAALEYASKREATILGKPSAAYFRAAIDGVSTSNGAVAMIGDDVESDVLGAMRARMIGVLVRTGKYKEGDESTIKPPPTATFDDLSQAVDWILGDR